MNLFFLPSCHFRYSWTAQAVIATTTMATKISIMLGRRRQLSMSEKP